MLPISSAPPSSSVGCVGGRWGQEGPPERAHIPVEGRKGIDLCCRFVCLLRLTLAVLWICQNSYVDHCFAKMFSWYKTWRTFHPCVWIWVAFLNLFLHVRWLCSLDPASLSPSLFILLPSSFLSPSFHHIHHACSHFASDTMLQGNALEMDKNIIIHCLSRTATHVFFTDNNIEGVEFRAIRVHISRNPTCMWNPLI